MDNDYRDIFEIKSPNKSVEDVVGGGSRKFSRIIIGTLATAILLCVVFVVTFIASSGGINAGSDAGIDQRSEAGNSLDRCVALGKNSTGFACVVEHLATYSTLESLTPEVYTALMNPASLKAFDVGTYTFGNAINELLGGNPGAIRDAASVMSYISVITGWE